jgi:hypothetical protein
MVEIILIFPQLCNTSDMQKVCDTMVEHKGWTVGHLVAHLNLVESVQNPRVLRYAIKKTCFI